MTSAIGGSCRDALAASVNEASCQKCLSFMDEGRFSLFLLLLEDQEGNEIAGRRPFPTPANRSHESVRLRLKRSKAQRLSGFHADAFLYPVVTSVLRIKCADTSGPSAHKTLYGKKRSSDLQSLWALKTPHPTQHGPAQCLRAHNPIRVLTAHVSWPLIAPDPASASPQATSRRFQ